MTETASQPDLLSRVFTSDPYPVYREMRAQSPAHKVVVKTLTVELNAWVVTRYDDARALLADGRLSKDAAGLPRIVELNKAHDGQVQLANFKSMLFSDPPDHTRLRRIMGGAFTMRRVQRLRPWIEQATERLLDRIVPGEAVDLVEALTMPLPISVIGALLGIPEERHEDFRTWNATLTSLDADMAQKARAHVAASAYLAELIARKRAEPGDDLISALVTTPPGDDRPLDDGELLATVFLVMNAGYETTASMLGNSIHALLTDPGQQAALRADPGKVPAAVEEFLRHESPLNLATVRYTLEPVSLVGVVIPADELVFISLAAANRDPGRFADPDRADLTRADNGHLAFGHGIHHCLGAPLARLEGDIVLRRLLERFPHWRLATDGTELTWRNSMQFRSLERLPVRFGY
jgi:cytochrome P450